MDSEEFGQQTAIMDALPAAIHPIHDNWRDKADALLDGLHARGWDVVRRVAPVAWTLDDLHLLEWAEKWQPRVEQLFSLHREGKTLRQEQKGYSGSCLECSREDVFVRWPCPTYTFLTDGPTP